LSCTNSGLSLAGVDLLHKDETGFALRPTVELDALIGAAYGVESTAAAPVASFEAVARALNRGELAHAMTAAVLSRMPELDWDAAVRLADAESRLCKYNPDEPRDRYGRWTDDAGADASGQDGLPENSYAEVPAGDVGGEFSASEDAGGDENDSDAEPDHRTPFERRYDDLSPVAFAKAVIQFGDQLARTGKGLSPEELQAAGEEYDFLQSRLNFWLQYGPKPPEVQGYLNSAALTLYQGAGLSGIVVPGVAHREIPSSMIGVAMGATLLDGPASVPLRGRSFENILPEQVAPSEEPAVPLEDAPPESPSAAPKEEASEEAAPIPGSSPATGKMGEIVDNDDAGVDWDSGIFNQGYSWQGYIKKKYPDWDHLADGAKTFDHFDPLVGEAISDKTLNTLTATYAMNPQKIYGKVSKYVDAAADYTPRAYTDVNPEIIGSKTIHLAVPEYTSSEQWRYLNEGIEYGRSRNVSVIVTQIRSNPWSGRN
jgi:hypothetical protein